MKGVQKLARFIPSLVVCLALLGMVGGTVLAAGSVPSQGARPQAAASSGYTPHAVEVNPLYKRLGKVQDVRLQQTPTASAGKVLYACQSDTNPQPMLCYGPDQIRRAYGVQQLQKEHLTGRGSTIVILDAFGSPTIQADLDAFDADWGLPKVSVTVAAPFGVDGSNPGWAFETTLDVEWAHVMAPGAAITLLEARTNSDVDLYNALKYAVDNNLGDVISMSFGENESCVDPDLLAAQHEVFRAATQKGITLVASSGDSGSAEPSCDGFSLETAASNPASDPLVTAIGGTALTANATSGEYIGETAWNEPLFGTAATGGGYSVLYPRPAYQAGATANTAGRGVPDIALNASLNGGVLVYMTDPFAGNLVVEIAGGTSVGAPEFAGIVADAVQQAHHRLGFLNQALYRLGGSANAHKAFHDITSGSNILFSSGVVGYTVRQGWDAVTGWGTPQADNLLPALVSRVRAGDAGGL